MKLWGVLLERFDSTQNQHFRITADSPEAAEAAARATDPERFVDWVLVGEVREIGHLFWKGNDATRADGVEGVIVKNAVWDAALDSWKYLVAWEDETFDYLTESLLTGIES